MIQPILLNCCGLPSVIEDIIIEYAYAVSSLKFLNQSAFFAALNSRDCPVPETWKKLVHYEKNEWRFCWHEFLQTNFNPYCPQTLINLSAVRETIRNLNWFYVKTLRTNASNWCLYQTKAAVLYDFNFWTPRAVKNMFLLQRLLTSVDSSNFLNKKARDSMQFSTVMILPTDPLCMYLNFPRSSFL